MKPADALAAFALAREYERDFEKQYKLPLGDFAALNALAKAPHRRLRLGILAAEAYISKSGLSRMTQRLTRAGLIHLGDTAEDGRGRLAVLTDTGYQKWKLVWYVPDQQKGA